MHVGERGHGLRLILAGEVVVRRVEHDGRREAIVTHEPGSFMGELAQLSGRPSLVDATRAERRSRRSSSRPNGCATCWSRRPSSASASCAR